MALRLLARDTAIYGGADAVSKLIAFVAFPMIAAALSPLAFGALDLLMTGIALLGLAANCGLNNALQRYYWDPETPVASRPTLVSTALATLSVLVLAATALGGIAMLASSAWVDPARVPIGWSGLAAGLVLMAAGQLVQFLLDVTRLRMAPWRYVAIALCSRVLTALAGVAAVVWLGWGLDGLLVAQALVVLAALPLALHAVRPDLTPRFDLQGARRLLRFGHPFVYAGLAFWLFGSMDRWLLASMSSVEEVGVYSVAHRFASVILFVSAAFGQAWSPLAIKIRADHPHDYRARYGDILLTLSCAMLLLGGGVSLFAREIVQWLMPAQYHAAGWSLAALALGLVLQSTMQVTAVGISLEHKTHLFARLSWLAAALNLALNFVMIPALGALGAAIATTLSYLFLTGSYLLYTQRLHPLPLPWARLASLAAAWAAIAAWVALDWHGHPVAASLPAKLAALAACVLVCTSLLRWRKTIEHHA